VNSHPVESDEDSAPASTSHTHDWVNWNGELENAHDGEQHCTADDECAIEPNNGIEDPEYPEQQDVITAPNVPRLLWQMPKSKRQAEMLLLTLNAVEMLRNT
jgi:hypothetical protein